jgi:glutamine---fructose-6-phosphate transaminase (isomerizing)
MAEPGLAMAGEIREGPGAIASAAAAAADVLTPRPRGIVIFARGSSDHAAIYGRYAIELLAGIPVVLGAPSLATVYGAPTELDGWLAIGVSQSGETREIVACLEWARQRGAGTMAITNDPTSQLAAAAEVALDLGCGEERAVAATKTFIAESAALAALAYGWSAQRADWAALVEAAEAAVAAPADPALVESLSSTDVLAVLGRGFRFPIALEIALKLMEACRLWAVGMSWADLLHGPIAALPRGARCLLLPDHGSLAESSRAVEARLEAAGATVLTPPPLPDAGVGEPLMPLLEALAMQGPILEAARRRGLDPDQPQGLTKVTQT